MEFARIVFVALCAFICAGLASSAEVEDSSVHDIVSDPPIYDIAVEPVDQYRIGKLTTLRLTFTSVFHNADTAIIENTGVKGGLQYLGPHRWTLELEERSRFTI